MALLAALLLAAAPAAASSPTEIVAAAPAEAWQAIPAEELLILVYAGGQQVIVQLAPEFAPTHVANIRALVRNGWYARHAAIVRVQDNYVVQWGDPTATAPLPDEVTDRPTDGYEQPGTPSGFVPLPFPDAYGATVGHANGWPVATDGRAHWLPHCPGMVGVGRDLPPDTGSGAELYLVIGHAPRHLDRNIAIVGRVLEGGEGLSALPRGTGPLGFYDSAGQHVKLVSARLGADLPEAERPRFEVLRSDSRAMAAFVEARANRRDAFFVRPAGSADICNLLPPLRRQP